MRRLEAGTQACPETVVTWTRHAVLWPLGACLPSGLRLPPYRRPEALQGHRRPVSKVTIQNHREGAHTTPTRARSGNDIGMADSAAVVVMIGLPGVPSPKPARGAETSHLPQHSSQGKQQMAAAHDQAGTPSNTK